MIKSILLLAAFVPSSDVAALNDLFDVLDQDKDGVISVSELSEAQLPYFQRALRVSDMNEDGALSRQELTAALQEPDRQRVSTNQRPGFDLTQFDTNKDGKLSRTEIPQPLMQRLMPLFEKVGSDEISLDSIRRFGQMQLRSPEGQINAPEAEKMKMEGRVAAASSSGAIEADRLAAAVIRLDADRDGQLSAEELKDAPMLARLLDRDRNGEVSARELAAARNQSRAMQSSEKAQAGSGERLNSQNGFFDRLDADKNGRLTSSELPQRIRSRFDRIDRDNNKSLSREEFEEAMRRQNGN